MLSIGQSLIDPGLDYARIQHVSCVAHLHNLGDSVLELLPIGLLGLADADLAIHLRASLMMRSTTFRSVPFATIDDDLGGFDRRGMLVVHRPAA